KNYIKRLLGLPGELLALFFGNLYRYAAEKHGPVDHKLPDVDPQHLWRRDKNKVVFEEGPLAKAPQFGMIENNVRDRGLFEKGTFEILRKSPRTTLAMRRIVYDNDYPAKDLVDDARFTRWPTGKTGWKA